MKIFITGNLGFIGTHLSEYLIEKRHTLFGLDKKQLKSNEKYKCIQGNILDANLLKESINDEIDLVIHLAAEHKDNVQPKSLYYDVNVKGTQNLVDACEINNVKKIIFTSSVAVYGLDLVDSHENSTLKPFNDYGKSKLQAEKVLTEWYKKEKNRSLSIIRPTVVFGERNRGNVYNLMKQVAEKKFIMIGKGGNKKSIAYVGNLVNFISSSIKDTGYSVTNYADKPDLTMRQLIDLINNILGNKENRWSIPYWFGISAGYIFDLLSFIFRREFSISSIRIKKFCANSIINTDKLSQNNIQSVMLLQSAIERTIQYEKDTLSN
ncbi:MAG: NAD-dependent epimerase/dehydratase family protein [Candidatus Marinimicrobia bacterium]|nr:NAD-dependent epimerase/dehydratase family protein [Candidatus Neomarinimicrobiota bacterium]